MSNHEILNWLVEATDHITLPHTEILRVKSILDDLQVSLDRLARQSEVPLTPGVVAIMKDMKHASTYISGTADNHIAIPAGKITTPTSVVPSQMDAAFAGQSSLKIENLYNLPNHPPHHPVIDSLGVLSKNTSVDIIGKSDFDKPSEPPKPGEVEAFVEKREVQLAAENETEEVYSDIDKLKEVFAVKPHMNFTWLGFKIRRYLADIKFDFDPKGIYPNVSSSESATDSVVDWFGFDPETKELVVTETEGSAYRITQAELKDFITTDVPHYDGRVVSRIVRRLKGQLFGDQVITADILPVGGELLLIILKTHDGFISSFTTTNKVCDNYIFAVTP